MAFCSAFSGDTCSSIGFFPNSSGFDGIGFFMDNSSFGEAFYFAVADFSQNGTYFTSVANQTAELIVEASPRLTPEPASLMLLGSGLIAVWRGASRRLRK